MYIELPKEDPQYDPNMLGFLRLCLYGTRDAALNWQQTRNVHLVESAFVRGIGHPSVFHHPTKDIWTLVHGDDYCSCGFKDDLDWLEGELKRRYEIKSQRISSTDLQRSDARILNRTVRRIEHGYELEGDQRHAEIVSELLECSELKDCQTPGIDQLDNKDKSDFVDLQGEH